MDLLARLYGNYCMGQSRDGSLESQALRASRLMSPDDKSRFDRCYSSINYLFTINECVRSVVVNQSSLAGIVDSYIQEVEMILNGATKLSIELLRF